MSDAWRFATIQSFVKVPVGPATVLLRVTADSSEVAGAEDARPTLVADDGESVTSYAAIPAPPDPSTTLRAAYAIPPETIRDETVFSLEFDDFFVIALPSPVHGTGRSDRAAPPAQAPAVTQDRRGNLQPKIVELSEELGETRQETFELRTVAESAQSDAQRLEDQLHAVRIAFAATSAELAASRELSGHDPSAPPATTAPASDPAQEQLVRSLQERLAATDRELEDVRRAGLARAAEAEAEGRASAAQLAELQVWTSELERRLSDTTTELDEARNRPAPAAEPGFEPAPGAGLAPGLAPGSSDPVTLAQIRDAAVAEAHARAARDLASVQA